MCIRTLAYGISSTNTRITYIKHGKGLELVDLLPMLTLEAPFDNDKGNGANGSKNNQNRELHIQSKECGIEETNGRRHGLHELEERKGAYSIVDIFAAQHGIDLRIDARIAQAQQECTDQCHGCTGRIQIRYIGGIFKRCTIRQINECHEVRSHVKYIARNDNGIASIACCLRCQDAKETAAKDLTGTNAYAHQANDLLGRVCYA